MFVDDPAYSKEQMIAFAEVSEAPLSSSLNLTLKQGCQCPRFYGWFLECHGFGHSVALIVPSGLYLMYLASQVNKSFAKLYTDRSHVQIWCYGFLWLVGPFNLAWFSFQVCAFCCVHKLNFTRIYSTTYFRTLCRFDFHCRSKGLCKYANEQSYC